MGVDERRSPPHGVASLLTIYRYIANILHSAQSAKCILDIFLNYVKKHTAHGCILHIIAHHPNDFLKCICLNIRLLLFAISAKQILKGFNYLDNGKLYYGFMPRQYFTIAALIFRLASSDCFLPYMGFLLPFFARLILNLVASLTLLLYLRAICFELL